MAQLWPYSISLSFSRENGKLWRCFSRYLQLTFVDIAVVERSLFVMNGITEINNTHLLVMLLSLLRGVVEP